MGSNKNKQKIKVVSTFHLVNEDEFERPKNNHEELFAKNKDCEELHAKNNHENLCAKSKGGPMSIY